MAAKYVMQSSNSRARCDVTTYGPCYWLIGKCEQECKQSTEIAIFLSLKNQNYSNFRPNENVHTPIHGS